MKLKPQSLTEAGTVLLLSSIAVKLIGALFKIPLSSSYALGDLGFGYFSAAYDMYIPLYTLALSGFPVAIARAVADFTAQNNQIQVKKVFVISLKSLSILGLVGSFLLCAFSLPIVSLIDKSGNSFYSILCIAPAVFFCCISSVYRGYFEGIKNMTPTAVSNIIEALCKLCLGLGGAVISMNITHDPALSSAAAMIGVVIGTLLSSVYLWITFRKNNCFEKTPVFRVNDWDSSLFKSLTALAIPIALASLSVGLTSLIDSLTLRFQLNGLLNANPENYKVLLQGTLYNDVKISEIPTVLYGIKGKAHTLFNLIPTLTAAFGIGALPTVTECFTKKDTTALKKNCNLCLKLSALISLPAAFGFFALGEEITALLYGNISSQLGGRLLKIYGISALFGGLTIPTTSLLQAIHKHKTALFNIVLGLTVKLAANLCLTPVLRLNIYGPVIGTAACFTVIFILNIVSLIKALGFKLDFLNTLLKPLFSALMCSITALIIKNLINSNVGTIIAIISGGAVYLLVLWISKAITINEILDIKEMW